ncbi:hypothetical protein MUY27_13420 [Mucilaginibacter sp. RS28]|uniref:Thiosulfate dehydrogenase [quinone] large subunit n=1 Tax=Mucilaginibacter straminoryzae TaxID=2932774 RepID=A0A9X1X535_9SPHI|nr:hypothetical protein [Mucilaginibacter straminoryzae]MCJ8210711.1 hypothetical protein [Mucilaginibacter straminoryzae]
MNKFKAIHIFRIGLGINMLMHGIVRIPNLPAFVAKSGAAFGSTILPPALTNAFLYVLPFLEALTGLLILLGGRLSRLGYITGGLIISVLIFGTTLLQDWGLAGQQVVYIIAFALALYLHDQQETSSLS